MRNQVLYSIIGVAALFLVNACQKEVVNPPTLKIPTTEFTADAAGGVVTVSYTLTNGVEGSKPSVDPVAEYKWVEDIAVETKAIKVTVAKNETTEPRTADFTVSYPGADNVEFTINQAAAGASSEYDYEYTVAAFMGMLYEEAETYDNYQIYMSSLPLTAEGGFDLTAVNYTFDLYANAGTKGAFPAGEYVLGEGSTPNTIGKEWSSYTTDGYETSITFTEGTMAVSIDGENYVFDVILKDDNGETHHLTYTGPAFEVGGDEPSDEVNYDLSYSHYSFTPFMDADNYFIELSDKPFDEDGIRTDGATVVKFDFYAASGSDGVFPAGTYEYTDGWGANPGTFGASSYIYTADSEMIHFDEGSAEVSKDGDDYVIEAVLVGEDGLTYNVHFTGYIGPEAVETEGDFEITVSNITAESFTYSIVPADKDMTYFAFFSSREMLEQMQVIVGDVLDEDALYNMDKTYFYPDLFDLCTYTGDLKDAEGPATSNTEMIVYCYGVNPDTQEKLTDVYYEEFTTLGLPAVITLDEDRIEAGADGYNGGVYYMTGGDFGDGAISAIVQYDAAGWLSATVDEVEKYISVTVTPNTTPFERTATITVTHPSVEESAVITVVQDAGELILTENPNWKVSYGGKVVNGGEVIDLAEVTASGSETYASPLFVSKADYDSKGLEEVIKEDYLYWKSMIDYYAGYYSWSDFISNESGRWLVEYLEDPSIEYYALIYGLESDGTLTGKYALSEPFHPEEIEVDEGYGKWIGTWRIEDASGVGYDVTISEGIAGMTYQMAGWQEEDIMSLYGETYSVPLEYDAESGNLVFKAGEVGTLYGYYPVYFLGSMIESGLVSGNYDIASAAFGVDENTATVNAADVPLSDGSVFRPETMQIFLFDGSGWYSCSDIENLPAFPMTMTKVSSSTASASPASVPTFRSSYSDGDQIKRARKLEPLQLGGFQKGQVRK